MYVIKVNKIQLYKYNHLWVGMVGSLWYVKDDMIIWAKLTQGNGRGTCCWITHTFYNNK